MLPVGGVGPGEAIAAPQGSDRQDQEFGASIGNTPDEGMGGSAG